MQSIIIIVVHQCINLPFKGNLVATALLFSQTEVCPSPVSIARARELCHKMKRSGFFQTTQRIDEEAVCRLYKEGCRLYEEGMRLNVDGD